MLTATFRRIFLDHSDQGGNLARHLVVASWMRHTVPQQLLGMTLLFTIRALANNAAQLDVMASMETRQHRLSALGEAKQKK